MIDPGQPLAEQVARQAKIIEALMRRADREQGVSTSAYSVFQSAIALQREVWAKTRDLEEALSTLGRASDELAVIRTDRERIGRNLSAALSAMEGGVALFADGRLESFNELFRGLLPDLSPRILPGLRLCDYLEALAASAHLLGPRPRIAELAREATPPGEPSADSIVLELRDDRWFQFAQQPGGEGNVILQLTEVTGVVRASRLERKHLIEMQAHFLQAAFDHMPYGVATFSSDGLLMICNQRFGALLGMPVAALHKGTTLAQVFTRLRRAHGRVASDPDPAGLWRRRIDQTGQLHERLRYGSGRVLDLHVDRLPGDGLLATAMDVTLEVEATELLERRVKERTYELTAANRLLREQSRRQMRAEEELRLAKERAEEAVTSKTRFLAAASHDLLQPVNAAKLLISTLGEQTRDTAFAQTVERLEASFASTEGLLHALLDISRLDSAGSRLAPTEICLNRLLHAIAEDLAPVAARRGLRLDVVPCSLWVRSDRHYLYRSIQNLVVNAIQYTDAGRVLLGCRRRGRRVAVEVWDTGIGIEAADLTRIFAEFTRVGTTQQRPGVGLGLSIVDRACRQLDHEVGVRSVPGRGSVFSIAMQRVDPSGADCEPEERSAAPPASGLDLIVLVVENDPDVLFATTRRLETWGASVLPARGLAAARQMVEDLGCAPDAILADFQLDDGADGVDAISAIRRQTGRAIPAIMVTAHQGEELVRLGARRGFSVLTKPVRLSRLRALLEHVARERAALDPAGIDQSLA